MAVAGQSRQLRLVGRFNCDCGFAGALGIALQHITAALACAQHQSVVAFAGGAELGVLFVEDFFDNFQQSPQQNQGNQDFGHNQGDGQVFRFNPGTHGVVAG